MGTSNPKKF